MCITEPLLLLHFLRQIILFDIYLPGSLNPICSSMEMSTAGSCITLTHLTRYIYSRLPCGMEDLIFCSIFFVVGDIFKGYPWTTHHLLNIFSVPIIMTLLPFKTIQHQNKRFVPLSLIKEKK